MGERSRAEIYENHLVHVLDIVYIRELCLFWAVFANYIFVGGIVSSYNFTKSFLNDNNQTDCSTVHT